MRMPAWLACALIPALVSAALGTPTGKTVLRTADAPERLKNAGLVEADGSDFAGWHRYEQGYEIETGGGREGGLAARCSAPQGGKRLGLSQTLTLNQPTAAPVVVSGWSRAENVIGSPDVDYSLYVDLEHQDGTPSWGNVASFSCGTHNWEQRRLVIYPTKPIKRMTFNALFRGRTGTVWFDELSAKEPLAGNTGLAFDGALVQPTTRPVGPQHSEIQIRDVAADSHFYTLPVSEGRHEVPELRLRVEVSTSRPADSCSQYQITVENLAGGDRALVVYYLAPFDAAGGSWFDNVREARAIEPPQEYTNTVHVGAGATGRTSRWPFACVAARQQARALLVTRPAVCHLGYHAGTRELYAAFDVALAPESKRPGTASVAVCEARLPADQAMRRTAALFYELLPGWFDQSRVPKRQGNWMAFHAVSAVNNPADFEFAVHEGDNDVAWDNRHGVQPMTWWESMPKEMPRTYEQAMGLMKRAMDDEKSPKHEIAWAMHLSGTFEADGRYRVDLLDTPWVNGAVFGGSADPDVAERGGKLNLGHHGQRVYDRAEQRATAAGGLAGLYLDSLEGWGRLRNHRREHFAAADLPLTFDTNSLQPIVLNAFSTQEGTEFLAHHVHARGKLLMANAVPHDFPFLALPLDLLGTEANWQQDGRFAPLSPDALYLKRALSWHKPYMFLLNTKFEAWTARMTEQYMQMCLFYGMFPGFFSENAATNLYFANPAWYERDRPLFKKYMPVIRKVAEAGWEVLTNARTDREDVWLERWGTAPASGLYYTILNRSEAQVKVVIILHSPAPAGAAVRSLITGTDLGRAPRIELTIEPGRVEVLRVEG